MTLNNFSKQQLQIAVFTSYLILFFYKYFNLELTSQQINPPLIYPSLNIPYWLFLLTGIKDLFFRYDLMKYALDFLIFSSCFLSILKNKSNIYPIIFTIVIWVYQYLYFSMIAYQPYTIGIFQYFLLYACPNPGKTVE